MLAQQKQKRVAAEKKLREFEQLADGKEAELNTTGDLRNFLIKHKSKLKLRDINAFHKKLIQLDIDLLELLDFEENDLRQCLQNTLTSMEIARLFNVLKTVPASSIYKAKQKPKTVIMLSNEEQRIIKQIKTNIKQCKRYTNMTNNALKTLNAIYEKENKHINDEFDNIINKINQRRNQLLNELY